MAVLLAFELTSRHTEVREKLLSAGFLNSIVGYHTVPSSELIESDLPSTLLFHPTYDGAEALDALRQAASPYGIHIHDRTQRAFAIEVEEIGAVGWRGVVSRFHSSNPNY
jgi:hypothetical protein